VEPSRQCGKTRESASGSREKREKGKYDAERQEVPTSHVRKPIKKKAAGKRRDLKLKKR